MAFKMSNKVMLFQFASLEIENNSSEGRNELRKIQASVISLPSDWRSIGDSAKHYPHSAATIQSTCFRFPDTTIWCCT